MKKSNKTLVLAMGTTLISGLASVANATEAQGGVFQMTELSSGYMQLAAADTTAPAKPTDTKAKTPEGKCAGAQPIAAPKAAEGKCGEGQCGGAMKHEAATAAKPDASTKPADATTTKPAADAAKPATATAPAKPADATTAKPATDATTKATEGKCGEGKCGGEMKKTASDATKPADSSAVKK
jgi:uncharacterized low-complexity protein